MGEVSLHDLSSMLFSEPPTTKQSQPSLIVGPIRVSDTATDSVVHGRGLVASRDIEAGECLFVMLPTVSAPIAEVKRVYATKSVQLVDLEKVAETILLKYMKRALRKRDHIAASFLLLTSGGEAVPSDGLADPVLLQRLLLGQPPTDEFEVAALDHWWTTFDKKKTDDELLQIIRRNAFGPDFYSFVRISDEWKCGNSPQFHRILGMYPFAAIINHSCTPNALRVFSGEAMIVHASTKIEAGEEIVWSYLPPTSSYDARTEKLRNFGFACSCNRCKCERRWKEKNLSIGLEGSSSSLSCEDFVALLEDTVLVDSGLTNETKHYLRLSHTKQYMDFFNSVLQQKVPPTQRVLLLAMQLHLAFCSAHNACTEHLSILHMCYDLTKDRQRLFWTEQLKQAHLVRYGSLGNDINRIRQVMQHTKLILRNRNGLLSSKWAFL